MKKGDVIIILMVALGVVLGAAYTLFRGSDDLNKTIVITQDHKVIHQIKISPQYKKTLMIQWGDYSNEVHIENGQVWIEDANCNNQVCVYEKAISRVGQSIVCLPHKLIIEIKGRQSSEVDIISE